MFHNVVISQDRRRLRHVLLTSSSLIPPGVSLGDHPGNLENLELKFSKKYCCHLIELRNIKRAMIQRAFFTNESFLELFLDVSISITVIL